MFFIIDSSSMIIDVFRFVRDFRRILQCFHIFLGMAFFVCDVA